MEKSRHNTIYVPVGLPAIKLYCSHGYNILNETLPYPCILLFPSLSPAPSRGTKVREEPSELGSFILILREITPLSLTKDRDCG